MLKMDADHIIPRLVDHLLDRENSLVSHDMNGRVQRGILIELRVHAWLWVGRPDSGYAVEQYRTIYLMFFGHTSVWVAVEPPGERWDNWQQVPLDAWKNTSNHDSCWRSDGLQPLSKLYFEMAEEVLAESIDKRLAPKDVEIVADYSPFSSKLCHNVPHF